MKTVKFFAESQETQTEFFRSFTNLGTTVWIFIIDTSKLLVGVELFFISGIVLELCQNERTNQVKESAPVPMGF